MAEVTIRGAGIFGLSVAWACLQKGATVRVIDPYGPGAGASGGIVGALAPHVPENWNAKKAFQFESLLMAQPFWAEVEALGGLSSGYGRTGRGPARIKLGAFPELSVENARKKAMTISANVAMGKPPLEAASGDDTTLGAVFETYLEVHAKPHKRSWPQDQYIFDRHLSAWTHRPLSQISKAELQRFHAEIGPKTETNQGESGR